MKQKVKTRSGRVLVLPSPAEDVAIAAGIAQDPETYEPNALELGMMRQHGIGCSLGADGALNLRPAPGSRKDFALELARDTPALPIGASVIELLQQEARLTMDESAGLRGGDALHLACAMEAKVKELVTLDVVLTKNARRVKVKPVGI